METLWKPVQKKYEFVATLTKEFAQNALIVSPASPSSAPIRFTTTS